MISNANSKAHPQIYCIGGANIDRKFTPLNNLTLGTSNQVTSMTTHGGVARNVAENLSRMQQQVHLITVVGEDDAGNELLEHMEKCQVNIENSLRLANENTAHYYAVLAADGEMHIAYADMNIYDNIPQQKFIAACEQIPAASIVMLDTNLPAEILAHVILAHGKKSLLCVDPVSAPKTKKLPRDLNNIFLLKPNLQEASTLVNFPILTIADAIKAGINIYERGVCNVVITMGSQGYVIVNEKIQEHFPVDEIENIIDVNGAGDAFFAGILSGLQRDLSMQEACAYGMQAASLTLQSIDTVVSAKISA